MILNSVPQNASLATLLHARAMRSPGGRVVLDVVVGTAVAGAAAWARPLAWRSLAATGVCFAMYGLWAMAEQRLEDEGVALGRVAELAWRGVRGAAAAIGTGSVLLLLFSLAASTLGTWIS